MQEDFAAHITELRRFGHELRTPLTLIQGYADLLKDDELTPDQRRTAGVLMLERCAEINRLITTFLDEASIQERLAIEIETGDLQAAR